MRYVEEIITPEVAKDLMKMNGNNRRVRPSHVKKLARIMENENFQTTHQGIAIGNDGRVLDGQHRLLAVMASGVTVRMMVARDVEPEIFEALDQGVSRTLSDIYGIDSRCAPVATFLAKFLDGEITSKSRQIEMYYAFEAEIISISSSMSRKKMFSSAPIAAAAVIASCTISESSYVLDCAKKLSAWEFAGLPPVFSSFVRFKQFGSTQKTSLSPASEEFLRALTAFDQSRQDNTKLNIRDPVAQVVSARNLIRRAYRAAIKDGRAP